MRWKTGKIPKPEEFPFLASEFGNASCSEFQNFLGLPKVSKLLPLFPSEENRKPATGSNNARHHSPLHVDSNFKSKEKPK